MEAKQAWNTAVDQLQREIPKASFDTWVRKAEFLTADDQTFQIGVQNAYAKDWLASRMQTTVEKILTGILNQAVEVQFQVVTRKSSEPAEDQVPPIQLNSVSSTPSNINPRYTFDNFVVGSSNRLAHAASLSVAEKPAQTYNPLFLYSGVGLGKTHLLYAIGNHCLKQNLQVLYVSSEEFTNDLITSIRGHTTQAFRDKYRRVDILLIDDIQFIIGKESTQEEFFHTFNTLHGQNKQIVLTSDCRPKAMVTLEERLRSRFEWGLTADIQAPDYETRITILQAQAERSGYQIPQHILETIARRFPSSIRELEGALTKLVAFAQLQGLEFTQDLVETAVADLIPRSREIEPSQILSVITREYNVTREELLSRGRAHRISHPRQVAMYLLREETSLSFPKIGELLGGRDHTTVMYGHEKITDSLKSDRKLKKNFNLIQEALYATVRV